jgi:ectoine hydroxylase-related dioxygenase (phytanoyl-CoA dioxygenase family)
MTMISDCVSDSMKTTYLDEGYLLGPSVIPPDLIARVVPRMEALVRGEYETGVPPHSRAFDDDDPLTKLRKIDQPHLCDATIHELVSHPALGELAAQVTGARMVQVWAVQQLIKPAEGHQDGLGNVGWHQDWQYWRTWWEPGSEVFTAWVAVTDVGLEMGPMHFVRGSHRWGFENEGEFYEQDLKAQQQAIHAHFGHHWVETPAILPAGAASFHHNMTYHGSGPNISLRPRLSFAIHMRTENSVPLAGSTEYYPSRLGDNHESPIVYDSR